MNFNNRGRNFREIKTCDNCEKVIFVSVCGMQCEIDGMPVFTTTVCDEHEIITEE